MARGDVVVKFSAEDAAFIQSQLKIRDSIEKTADSARKMATEVAKAGDAVGKMGGGSNQTVASLASLASGYVTAAAAAGALLKVENDLEEQRKKKAAKFNNQGQGLMDVLGNYGRTKDFTQLDNVAGAMKTTAFDHAGISKIIAETVTRTSGEFSTQNYAKAAVAAVKAVEGGLAPDKASAFAANRLQIEKNASQKGGGWENLSDEQKNNLAFKGLEKSPDGFTPQDVKLLNRAPDKNKGLALINALHASGEKDSGGEKLEQLAGYLPTNEELKKWKQNPSEKKLSEEERSKKHIYESGSNPQARLEAILKNPKGLVTQTELAQVENISRAYDPEFVNHVNAEQPLNKSAQQRNETIQTNPNYKAVVEARKAEVKGGQLDDKGGLKASEKETEDQKVKNAFREKVVDSPVLADTLIKLHHIEEGLGSIGPEIIKLLSQLVEHSDRGADAQEKTARQGQGTPDLGGLKNH